SLYTLEFHALRMRAVELAATLSLRESICSRKAARAAAGRASSALRTAAPIQRALWQRIVSSSIDLDRPQPTRSTAGLQGHGAMLTGTVASRSSHPICRAMEPPARGRRPSFGRVMDPGFHRFQQDDGARFGSSDRMTEACP